MEKGDQYRNQKKEVFLDSHVRFFEMVHGVYAEVVYDNMRNVVTKFIGRNEKELSPDLVAMSTYYGFTPNVTNCFRGNEKGFVESSVTGMHEGVHWMIHREAFSEDNPFGPAGIYANQFLAAKEGRGDYTRSTKEKTDVDRMERQADFLAASILMPRPALREVYREFFRHYGEKPRRIFRGASQMDDSFAVLLPEYAAKVFNVSKKAATIRFEKLTAIVNRGYPY